MKSVNRVTLLGKVSREPELRDVGGNKLCTFGLATNRVWTDKKGETQSVSEDHTVIARNGLAEFCGAYVKKGKPLYVEGYLQTSTWETHEGIRKDRTDVVIDNIVLLGAQAAETNVA